MQVEDRELIGVDGLVEVTVTVRITVSLDESELADLMNCEAEELVNLDEYEIEKKAQEYAEYNWQDYHQHSEIDDIEIDTSIEPIYAEKEEEEETN